VLVERARTKRKSPIGALISSSTKNQRKQLMKARQQLKRKRKKRKKSKTFSVLHKLIVRLFLFHFALVT